MPTAHSRGLHSSQWPQWVPLASTRWGYLSTNAPSMPNINYKSSCMGSWESYQVMNTPGAHPRGSKCPSITSACCRSQIRTSPVDYSIIICCICNGKEEEESTGKVFAQSPNRLADDKVSQVPKADLHKSIPGGKFCRSQETVPRGATPRILSKCKTEGCEAVPGQP